MSIKDLDFNKSYSYADYLKWTFQDTVELIKGKIFPMAAPLSNHQTVVGNVYAHIKMSLKQNPCRVFVAPFDVRLPKPASLRQDDADVETVVQPDVCVICDLTKIDRRGCLGAPDLMVEVLSKGTSNKDVKEKYNVYEEAGVREYWIVSVADETVSMFRLREGQFVADRRPYVQDDSILSDVLGNQPIPVQDIFEGVIDFGD